MTGIALPTNASRTSTCRSSARPTTAGSATSTASTYKRASLRGGRCRGVRPVAEGCVGGGTGMNLPRVQGRYRHIRRRVAGGARRLDGRRAGPGELRHARIHCASTACRSARDCLRRGAEPHAGDTEGRLDHHHRRHRRAALAGPMPAASRSGRRSGSPGSAATATTAAATSSSPSRPATRGMFAGDRTAPFRSAACSRTP